VAVFAPSPVVTVTIEALRRDGTDVHFRAGGHAPWPSGRDAKLDVLTTSQLGADRQRRECCWHGTPLSPTLWRKLDARRRVCRTT